MQRLKVAFGVRLEKPCVPGSKLKHLVFIVLLCYFFGRLQINPGRSLGTSLRWEREMVGLPGDAEDVETKEHVTHVGEHPA